MKSLGYLEVEGLSTALVAADKMLKTADVELQGIENSKGSGWIMISITGDVAAVSVAVDAGTEAAGDQAVTSTVIANPAEGVEAIGKSDAILGRGVKASKNSTDKPSEGKTASSTVKSQNVAPSKATPVKPATTKGSQSSADEKGADASKDNAKSTKAKNTPNNKNNN